MTLAASSQPRVCLGTSPKRLARLAPHLVLSLGFVVQRPFDRAEAVHVLDFHDRRGDAFAIGPVDVQVDVGVDPQASFLHVAVRDAQIHEQQLELVEICLGFGRRAHVGLATRFPSSGVPARFRVDAAIGLAGLLVVHALAGVFLQVSPDDPHVLGRETSLGVADLQGAVEAERQIVLADLVSLRQVGIVILLAIPLGKRGDFAIQRHGRRQRQLETRRRFITGSVPGMPDANRAGLRIGRAAEARGATAEQLALSGKLHVDFQPDDGCKRRVHGSVGLRVCQSVAF